MKLASKQQTGNFQRNTSYMRNYPLRLDNYIPLSKFMSIFGFNQVNTRFGKNLAISCGELQGVLARCNKNQRNALWSHDENKQIKVNLLDTPARSRSPLRSLPLLSQSVSEDLVILLSNNFIFGGKSSFGSKYCFKYFILWLIDGSWSQKSIYKTITFAIC
jgi:hypothetical protein